MASLARHRADVVQCRDVHKSTLSPIRRLPPEILGEIFSCAVYATFHFRDISEVLSPVSHHAPWLLTRICHRWSAVALATPALWSMVFLNLDRIGERGAAHMTNLYLERSQNMPLTLRIMNEHGASRPNPVLDAAMSSCERWEIVDLYVPLALVHQLTTIHGRLAALRTLLISIDLDTPDDEFWDTFAIAPQLRSLQVLCWQIDLFLAPPFSLPWHQLTRVCTTFTYNHEVLFAPRELSNVVECKFAFGRFDLLPRDTEIVLLPHLRSLTLQIENDLDEPMPFQKGTSLLDFLNAPSLQVLTTRETADEAAVLGFVTRSDCAGSLLSFHFYLGWIIYSATLHLVQKMPRLTSLEIGNFNTFPRLCTVPSFTAFTRAFCTQGGDIG
ncbi:hypothetical protein DFH06DRAFT_1075407 [Mycena polygramma]|nr:hypothetical protein DFH06DRAFT_1075407 [Mycena polygramma]